MAMQIQLAKGHVTTSNGDVTLHSWLISVHVALCYRSVTKYVAARFVG